MYLKIAIFILFFILSGCSIIDKGKIPLETNVKGIETSFARIGSVTTKYQSNVGNIETKGGNTENNYPVLFNTIIIIFFVIIILIIDKYNKRK